MPVTEAQKRATAKYEKENYDKVLVRFPKGTKERIQNAGVESVNGYIIQCVLDSLEMPEKAKTEQIIEPAEEVSQEHTKAEFKPITEEENAEFLKLIAEKKAEYDRRAEEQKKRKEEQERQEKEERKVELVRMVERMRNGEQIPEDEEKEQLRQESIIKSQHSYY